MANQNQRNQNQRNQNQRNQAQRPQQRQAQQRPQQRQAQQRPQQRQAQQRPQQRQAQQRPPQRPPQQRQAQQKKKGSKMWLLFVIVAVAAYMHFSGNGLDSITGLIPGFGEKSAGDSDHIIAGIDELSDSDDYRNSDSEERGRAVEDYLREAASEGSEDGHGNTIVPDSIVRDEGSGSCIYTDSDGGLNVIKYETKDNYTTGSSQKGSAQEVSAPPKTKGIILFGLDKPGSTLADDSKKIAEGLRSQGSDCEIDNNVTVDEYENKLSGYDYVIINTHGSMLYYGYGFKNESSDIVPVLCTMEDVTSDNLDDYAEDVEEQRIAKVYTIDSKDPNTKHYRYWIMPSFFTKHYDGDDLDDTYIHLGSCCSFGGDADVNDGEDKALANALISRGATAVTGYYNSVFTYYDYGMISEIMKKLFEGNTLSTSVEAARKAYGKDDEEYAMRQGWLSPDCPYQDTVMDKISDGVAYMVISGDANMRFGDARDEQEETKPTQEETQAVTTDVIGYWADLKQREELGDELLWNDSIVFLDNGTGYLSISGGSTQFNYNIGNDGKVYITDETGRLYTGEVSGNEIRLHGAEDSVGNGKVFTYEGPPAD